MTNAQLAVNTATNLSIESASIDSASLVIPVSKLSILSAPLKTILSISGDDLAVLSLNSGEVLEDINPRINDDVRHDNGITTTYYKVVNTNIGSRNYRQCIAISINSKQLKKDYFQGITLGTVTALYNEIISQGVISVSLEEFAGGFITDVDIKKDYQLPTQFEDFSHFSKSIEDGSKEAFKEVKAVKRFNQKGNQGIQFGYRGNGSNMPFFKIYNKDIELETNSKQFKDKYKIDCIKPLRFEITLKNKSQLVKFGLLRNDDKQTFSNVLKNVEEFDMKKVLSIYVDNIKPSEIKKQEALSEFDAMQKIELQCFKLALEFLELANDLGGYIDLTTLTNKIIHAMNPTKNTLKGCKWAIETAYIRYTKTLDDIDEESDLFSFV